MLNRLTDVRGLTHVHSPPPLLLLLLPLLLQARVWSHAAA
jgi:hypothetical protein